MYGRKLADDLRDDTSGDFKHLLVAMVQGQRDETWTHNEDEAKADAQAIFDVSFDTRFSYTTKIVLFHAQRYICIMHLSEQSVETQL